MLVIYLTKNFIFLIYIKMGIIKNIILILVILITLYIVGLFVFPEKTRSIGDYIGLQSFNDFVISFKGDVDKTSTKYDSTDINLKKIQSGATEMIDSMSNSAKDLIDTVGNGAKDLKDKVDSVRSTASGVEKTYNELKNQMEDASKTVQEAQEKVKKFNELFN
ncbi:hypothetical protein D8B46_06525 [Candidatus Gracilibacteria bacterium]|nr:MAG: hypothetical protein D8B46_06525 [Candidatus Gracilibacteria bacterium]